MNDLDLLRDFAPEAPLLTLSELSIPRERVLATALPGGSRSVVLRWPLPRRSRLDCWCGGKRPLW